MINNLTKYKKAIIHVKELAKLEQSLVKALIEIEPHRRYIPAQECLEVLSNSLLLVRTHLKHQQKIVETKGRVDET